MGRPATPAGSTYTWVGGTPVVTTDWTVATNWNPQRLVPAATDNLVIDGSSTPSPIISNIPTETIATLTFTNGVAVTFNAASGSQLTIAGATGIDLSIPSQTSLTVASANALTISLSAGSKAIVAGQITFQDAGHQLKSPDANGITFQGGSIFTTAAGFSGNPFGTGTNGSVAFQSGSAAFFNAGSDPFGASGHSVATFNQGSSQTFNSASAFVTDGRTYGNLTLDGNQAYSGAGSGLLTIFNTLTIVSGSTLTLSTSAGGDLNLLGDIAVNGTLSTNGRTVKFQGGSVTQNITTAATFGDVSISKTGGTVKLGGTLTVNGALQFDGTGSAVDVLDFNQNILNLNGTIGGASGSISNGFKGDATGATLNIGGSGALGTLKFVSGSQLLKSLTVNRTSSGAVTLGSNLTIGSASAGGLTLTDGIVDVGSNTLSLASFPAITRTNGYVIGNLQKTFSSTGNFTFTVGTANSYSAVDANITAGTGNSLTVKAVQGKHPNIYASNALLRYWTITNSGSVTANLTFNYLATDVVGTEANYKIFKYNGSFTQFAPNTLNTTSHFATLNGVSSFSDWTLADPALTVNTTADADDGACTTPGTGNGCTLREAINAANSSSDPNTINFSFAGGDSGCSGGVCTISLATALPDIATDMTIAGTGASSLTVKRSTAGGTPGFRIFTIDATATATISGLTLSNGNPSLPNVGGAILNSGNLKVNACVLSGNTAGNGGGLQNIGTLTLNDSIVSGNTGGGAMNHFIGSGPSNAGTMSTLTVNGSTISGNTGFSGINNDASLGSTSICVINNSTVSGNSNTSGWGGGVSNTAGDSTSLLTINNSTISGNQSVNSGGGIYNSAAGQATATVTITNTTISGNSDSTNGGAIYQLSHLSLANASVSIFNGTITGNTTDNSGGSGGIVTATDTGISTLTLRNTIVAGNLLTPGMTPSDVFGAVNPASSFNLIGNGAGLTGINNGNNGNQIGTAGSPINAMLSALASNGGPTRTHLLLPGSPAINAGSNANLPLDAYDLDGDSNTTEPLPVDQRGVGFPRVLNTTVDIGAVEEARAGTSTNVGSSSNPSDSGQTVTFSAAVTSGAGTPTGIVQFKDGGTAINCSNVGGQTLSAGVASCQISTLSAGTHPITADYSGDANFNASTGTLSGGQVVRSLPMLQINDVSMTEGDSGTKTFTFVVTMMTSNLTVTVDFATADGTPDPATAGTDYLAKTGTLTFSPGQTSKTLDITVDSDQSFEPDEHFFVNLSNPTNANLGQSRGIGTIINDDAQGGIITFSQSNYTVGESDGSVAITVSRSGDTSGAASVDYSTPDDSELANVVPCATANGIAQPRCDFTTALGTLQFAPGETSKTFVVLISQDNFAEGSEGLQFTLSNLTGGAVFGANSMAMLTINDDDISEPATNPNNNPEDFVRQHYHDFLNREPDAAGLDFWKRQITDCGGDAQCIDVKRINVSGAFYLSIEFQGTGYLVERMYKVAYGDVTGASSVGGAHPIQVPVVRFAEFLRDTQKIGQGVIVGAPGWENQLEANKNSFAAEFVQRSRFSSAYSTGLSPTDFVNQLFAKTGTTPTPTEKQSAIDEFGGAADTTNLAARGRALRKVAENQAFNQAEFNRAFVLMQYFGYLRRNPNAETSADYTGYDFWLTKLNQFGGNFQNAEMVKAFLSADEYRHRFGP